ncbi:MAG: hypothetical protein AAGC60_05105 [Acidobacteriota bacterium]
MRDSSQRAFELAYFIHCDRSIARRLSIEALDQLETVAQVQERRSYYRVIGRRGRPPRRDKVSLQKPQLLQVLIYLCSERYEVSEEGRPGHGGTLSDADRIVRYLVHLVRISLARNSFYASVGLGRLLYRYDTSEVIQVYDVLIQDPERYRGADAIRACKKKLMHEILKRFGPILRVHRTSRGERMFETRPVRDAPIRLIRDTLEQLTPWDTECSLPTDLEPRRHQLSSFFFAGSNPDREHEVELRRLHTVVHPPCFAQLVTALGFATPEQSLALPIFFTEGAGGDDDHDPQRRVTTPLSADERRRIGEELETRARRRAPWTPGQLSFKADGVRNLGVMDLMLESRCSVRTPSDLRILEVWGEHPDGPVRLATYLPTQGETADERAAPQVVRLADGQQISFRLEAADDEILDIVIRYRETKLVRIGALGLARSRARWARARCRVSRPGPRRLAVATVLAAMIGGALILQDSFDSGPGGAASGVGATQPGPAELPVRDVIRGSSSPSEARKTLHQVEAVHIEPFVPRFQSLQRRLTERLVQGARFRLVGAPEAADAVLAVAPTASVADPTTGEPSPTRVELVNRAGEILWSGAVEPGPVDQVAERLAESLETAAAR